MKTTIIVHHAFQFCRLPTRQTQLQSEKQNKKTNHILIHSFSKNAGLTKEKARGFVAVKEIKLLWHILLKADPGSLGFLIEGALPMNTKGCLILHRLVMKSLKATNKQLSSGVDSSKQLVFMWLSFGVTLTVSTCHGSRRDRGGIPCRAEKVIR